MEPARLEVSALGRAMARISRDALLCIGHDGCILEWNPAAEQMFGWREDEAVGKPIDLIIPETERHEDEVLRSRALQGEIVAIHTIRRRADDRLVRVLLTMTPLSNQDGTVAGVLALASDSTAREEADRAARRLAAIVESSDDAIISKDLNGFVMSWNDAAERMFGYSAAEMIGRSIRTLIPDDRQAEEDATLETIRRGDKVDHFETVRRRKNGELLQISLTVSPIRTEDGRIVGASKIARDITLLKQAEAERLRLLESVQEANRLKDDFLASLSHELRTPLNAILGYARMLHSGIVAPDKRHRAVETIERNATSLTQIVEDVLDISRIVSGKMRLNVHSVNLAEIVRASIDAISPAAEAKGIRVQTDLGVEPTPILGDSERLQQILWNLTSNAVKFTNRGGRILVELERTDGHVDVVVRDTGIGIPPQFLPHMFERFRQADAGLTRGRGGLGLGLAIVRQLVEMHGGTVEASSDGVGRGAAFRVRLPLMAPQRVPEEQRRTAMALPQLERPMAIPDLHDVHVLAVDDDRDALTLVSEVLEAAGARVTTASSAGEALSALDWEVPDVLIADLGMPQMNGFELIEHVKRHPDPLVRELPSAALTAFARSEDREKVLQAGFRVHVAKPIDPAELMATVAVLAKTAVEARAASPRSAGDK